MAVIREFSKDVVIYGIGSGIKKFISLFLLPFYTRVMSPEEYGILNTLAMFIMIMVAFLDIGMNSASSFYFFKAKDEYEKGSVLYTFFVIRLFLIIPPLILSLFSESISLALFNTVEHTWVIFISCLIVPTSLLMKEQENIFRYHRLIWKYNFLTILKSLLGISGGILLVVILKYGVLGAQIAALISSFIVIVCSFFFYGRKIYVYRFSWVWAKKMFSYGFPLVWAGIATWIFNGSDRFFLLHYRNLTEIGYYSVASTFSQSIQLINLAVQMSYGVMFFSVFNKEADPEKKESKNTALKILNLYLFVSISLAVGLSVFSVDLLSIFATSKYLAGTIVIPFILFSRIAAQAFQTTGPGIEISQKTWHFTWITILTALVNIGLNFYFIPKYGYIGAAFTTLLSFVIYWTLKYVVSQYYFYIKYRLFTILTYFFIGFLLSIAVPFLEIELNVEIKILTKAGIFLFGIILPFILRILSIKDLKEISFKNG